MQLKKLLAKDIKEDRLIPENLKTKKISLPDKSLYEYLYRIKESKKDGEWVLWTDMIPPDFSISKNAKP